MAIDVFTKIASSGFILIAPILVWNLIFASKLPPIYRHKPSKTGTLRFLSVSEQIFRYIIFLSTLFMRTDVSTVAGKAGLVCYLTGITIYLLSWLPQLFRPVSRWSTSSAGFLAPAYTPLVWLVGVSLMVNSYLFRLRYTPWHYIVPSIIFSIFHVSSMYRIYKDRD